MSGDVACELLAYVCRRSSDPEAAELCRKYVGEVFDNGEGRATEWARRCADTLGLVVLGDRVVLRELLAEKLVEKAREVYRSMADALSIDAGGLAAMNALIAASLAGDVDAALVAWLPCPYRSLEAPPPFGKLKPSSKTVTIMPCFVRDKLPDRPEEVLKSMPGAALLRGYTILVNLGNGVIAELKADQLRAGSRG